MSLYTSLYIFKKGFSLIEIILALAVVSLICTAVFGFVTNTYVQLLQPEFSQKYISYNYGQPYCLLHKMVDDIQFNKYSISFLPYVSTSTHITSIHRIYENNFIITTDSASTSEPDIFLFTIATTTEMVSRVNFIDVGPGIQDSVLLGNFLYVANTSVNSHIKSFKVNILATSTGMFTELSNIRIPSLAASVSNPKKLSIYNHNLILGSEKSNTGPEVFILPIEQDGAVRYVASTTELDGQLNQAVSAYEYLYIATAADPELRGFIKTWREFFSYDAPLTLGNGKSILYMNPYIIFGRTLGSGELSLLQVTGTSTKVLDTKRTNGTVDFIQELVNQEDSIQRFITITANDTKELQFWHIENFTSTILDPRLILDKTIDLSGRVTAYTCVDNTMYLFMSVNNQSILTWLNL